MADLSKIATPMSAVDFLTTLGVNTHIPGAPLSDLSSWVSDLQYLGIDQVRDFVSTGTPAANYIEMAQAGIQFTFLVAAGGTLTTSSLNAEISEINQIETAVPGSVTAVEGANEPSNFPITFNGVGGIQGVINFQEALYSAVHSDPTLTGVPVDYWSGWGWTGIANGPNLSTTSGLADYDNQHIYPGTNPPYAYINATELFALANNGNESVVGSPPGVVTEFGYPQGSIQAPYLVDGLLDAAASGIAKTYVYDLYGDSYALFNANDTPTAAATAIHNLTTILADPGNGGVAPTALNDTITGLPSNAHSLLLEKSTGVFDLALWNEGSGQANVTVNLGATYGTVDVVDVITGATVSSQNNVSSVTMELGQHAYVVEITGQATSAGSGGHHHHS